MKRVVLLITLMFSSLAFAQSQVPTKFWGIQFNQTTSPYPVSGGPTFQTFRFWDTGTSWEDMQTQNGYNFQPLDNWMAQLIADYGTQNFDVIYTIAKTPGFISSNPQDACNSKPSIPPGSCVPPSDVTCSGSGIAGTGGSDATLVAFVQALWNHIEAKHWNLQREWFFEIWNEPTDENETQAGKANFWDNYWISHTYCAVNGQPDPTGPRRILARIAHDVKLALGSVTTPVQFLSPPPPSTRQAGTTSWWQNYLSGDGGTWGLNPVSLAPCSGYVGTANPCGGGQFADIISVHAYLDSTTNETPDDICCDASGSDGKGTAVYNTLQAMSNYNQGTKPLFITEGSWGGYCANVCPTNFDPVAYTGRYYTLMVSQAEVTRFAWYNYDNYAPFWCSDTYGQGEGCMNPPPDGLSTSGIALGQMQSVWGYDGGTFNASACQKIAASCGGHFRACGLTEGVTSTTALVAWYDVYSNSCSYTPPPPGPNLVWIDYRDLSGHTTNYSGGSVSLTNSPILFEASPSTR